MIIRHDGGGENMRSIRRIIVGALIACAIAAPAFAQDAVGKWVGTVKAPGQDLPIIVVIAKDGAGKLSATLESTSQAPGVLLAADTVANEGDKLSLTFDRIMGDYKATWNAEAKVWVGTWTQAATPMKLTMTRGAQ
jgi:hypothetical protein